MMRLVAFLVLVAVVECRLRGPANTTKAKLQTISAVSGAHEKVATNKVPIQNTTTNATKNTNTTKKAPKANLTDAQKLERLETGLDSINKLRALFTQKEPKGPADGAEKFADGAMSQELSKKDSSIWSMITSMITATQKTTVAMKSKNQTAQKAMMAALESTLNSKAEEMSKITQQVNIKQEEQNEEYMLGLLILHKKNWNMTQQVAAVERMTSGSPVLKKLLKNHNDKQPLADQLAVLMDKKPKNGTTAARNGTTAAKNETAAAKNAMSAAGKKAQKAAKMFIQLASALK